MVLTVQGQRMWDVEFVTISPMHSKLHLNLNLNGLLVTRQIDNISPGGGGAPGVRLVPGSHKRCELGHTVIRHFSRGEKRIREVILVPDSLWKGTTFVRFFAS